MIHARCGKAYFETVVSIDVENMPEKEKKKAVSACVRSDRKDLFVERKLALDFRELWKC